MNLQRIPKRTLVIWEIMLLLCTLVVLVIILLIYRPYTLFWYALLWSLGAVYILTTFIYLPLLYCSYSYALLDKYFVVSRGVFMHKTHYIALDKIAFVSIYTNPFTKILNLSSLIITAPGGYLRVLLIEHNKVLEISKKLSTIVDDR